MNNLSQKETWAVRNKVIFVGRFNEDGKELAVAKMDGGFVVCSTFENQGGHPAHPRGTWHLTSLTRFTDRQDALTDAMFGQHKGFDVFTDKDTERLFNLRQKG